MAAAKNYKYSMTEDTGKGLVVNFSGEVVFNAGSASTNTSYADAFFGSLKMYAEDLEGKLLKLDAEQVDSGTLKS